MQTDNGLSVETKRAFARNGNFWILNRDKISYDAIKLGRMGRSYGKCRFRGVSGPGLLSKEYRFSFGGVNKELGVAMKDVEMYFEDYHSNEKVLGISRMTIDGKVVPTEQVGKAFLDMALMFLGFRDQAMKDNQKLHNGK